MPVAAKSARAFAPLVAVLVASDPGRVIAEPAPVASAASSPSDPVSAGQHWARAQRLRADGDLEGAVLAVRQAYELVASPVLLFELARLHARLDRPREAKIALDRLLSHPGDLSRAKLDEALRMQTEQARRLARLRLVAVRPAAFWVDGRPVEAASGPVVLNPGDHVVTAAGDGVVPITRVVQLQPGESADSWFDLVPAPGARPGTVVVKSEVDGADVLVNGGVVGRSPLPAPVPVLAGVHTVEFRRIGYRPGAKAASVEPGAAVVVTFEPEVDPSTPVEQTGRLSIQASEPDVSVTVNGLPRGTYKGSLLMPAGPHRLKVERKGFEPVERGVTVPAGGEANVVVTLEPTPANRAGLAREAHSRRRWAWAGVAAGAATLAASTTFVVLNERRLDRAQNRLDAIDADQRRGSGGACDPLVATEDPVICRQTRLAAEDRVVSHEFQRLLGAVGIGMGLGAIGMGLVHMLTGPDPDQYDRAADEVPMAFGSLRLTPVLTANGAALTGRF